MTSAVAVRRCIKHFVPASFLLTLQSEFHHSRGVFAVVEQFYNPTMVRRTRRRVRARRAGRKSRRGMRRRTVRRYAPKRRIGQSKVYTFKRSTEVTLYNTDPALAPPEVQSTDSGYLVVGGDDPTSLVMPRHKNFGITFIDSFSKLQNNTEFIALFDYVRIARITRTWYPIYGSGSSNVDNSTTAGRGYAIPTLMSVTDKDSSEPITMAVAREKMGVSRHRMNRPFSESFRPVPAMPVGATTAGASSFAVIPKRAPWLNSVDAGPIVHYGKRYGIYDWPGPSDGTGAEGDEVPCAWRIVSNYTIQCKGLQ